MLPVPKLVLLAAFSGLRRGELFGLRRHVDRENRTSSVEVQRQQLSNGEHSSLRPSLMPAAGYRFARRGVRAPHRTPRALDGAGENSWVFTGPKGAACGKVSGRRNGCGPGLQSVYATSTSTTRHVAATLAAATGAGVKEIMYRIGHSSPQARCATSTPAAARPTIAEGISELIQFELGQRRGGEESG